MSMTINTARKEFELNKQMEKLEAIATQRLTWQSDYDRTNASLYQMLADCLALYNGIKGKPLEKHVLTAIKDKLAQRGSGVYKNTSVLKLIVRYVFDAERQRSHTYARALAIAVNNNVTPERFSKWVNDFGGIQEVISTQGKTFEALRKRAILDDKVNVVKDMLDEQLENPLSIVPATALVQPADTVEYTLFIGKMQANGQSHILSAVPSTDAMINNAIGSIARKLIENEKQTPTNTHVVQQDIEDQAVEEAVYSDEADPLIKLQRELALNDEYEFA